MLMQASRTQSKSGRHPERGTARHQNQRSRTQNRTREKVRAAAAQAAPGPVAGVADDGLYEQSGQRRGEPENWNLIGSRPQVFVDGAHVRHLQSPAKLDAEETEAHVPDLPEGSWRLVHGFSC